MVSWLRSHMLAAVAAGLWVILLVLGARMGALMGDIGYVAPEGGFSKPILALEFPERPQDVTAVVLAGGVDRRPTLDAIQRLDNVFVPVWSALGVVLAMIAARHRRHWGIAVAMTAVVAFIAAAVFDYRENAAIDAMLRGLDPALDSSLYGLGAQRQAAAGALLDGSPLAAAVVMAASWKFALLFVGAGLTGFLLLVRPYRPEWRRFAGGAAGGLYVLGATIGSGLVFDPRSITLGVALVAGGALLLTIVAAAWPAALRDPYGESRADMPGPRSGLAKVDHLLPLASAALETLGDEENHDLRHEFGAELAAYISRDAQAGGDVPPTVQLALMADLLMRRPDDAIRLASVNWGSRARVIDDLVRDVERRYVKDTTNGHRSPGEWLAHMMGGDDPALGDVSTMLAVHGVVDATPEELRRALLVNPDLAVRVAERIGFAVPFTLAQHAEIAEVELSRLHRLAGRPETAPASDPAAERGPDLKAVETERRNRLAALRNGRVWYAPRRAADLDLVGLALSGGGIRSATFNLGVIQAMASLDLLRRVDYLSTVSGGGYIGSWLVLWIRRIGQMTRRDPRALDGAPRSSVVAVERRLSPITSPDPNVPAVRPIRFLREFSNYLTPQRGLLGADTWTVIAVWFRNLLLIQSVLVLSLAGALLLPRALGQAEEWLALQPAHYTWVAFALGLFCFFGVSWRASTELARFEHAHRSATDPTRRLSWAPTSKAGVMMVQFTLIVPAFLCGLLIGGGLFAWARRGWYRPEWMPLQSLGAVYWCGLAAGALVAAALTVVALRAGYARALVSSTQRVDKRLRGAIVILLSIVGPALLATGLMTMVARLFGWWAQTDEGPTLSAGPGPFHVTSFGAPIIIEVLALALVLHIGLMGRAISDDRREWWSRLGAWLLIYSVIWMGVFAVAVYAPVGVARAVGWAGQWIAAMGGVAWLASTAWGAYAAQSPKTAPASSAAEAPARNWRDKLAAIAPYVFVVGLLVLVALANHVISVRLDPSLPAQGFDLGQWFDDYWTILGQQDARFTLVLAGIVVGLALVLAWRVDINEFSMHHFYKNRLVRCYLGASREGDREQRSPHPFTGFDASDDAPLASLRTDGRAVCRFSCPTDEVPDEPYVGPLPIINTALNLVKGDDLAWQERRAQSFVFTPLFSGYEQLSLSSASRRPHPSLDEDGLRPTCSYGYPNGGVHIGTAMAISGAAANPNMGYHSSPAAAFLMTMFNVRLGWWLGNPRHRTTWTRSSPLLGITYLVNELLGNTKSSSAFVNLSDGGHFENLGIYELVRRQCRLIIACDAEQDGDRTFNGLGNAIRKCRTDFGVEIDVQPGPITASDPAQRSHWVEGRIRYPGGELGRLIYLKSSLTGDEPADVFEYSRRVKKFPHESTADQFFDESQFESYRQLGYHIGSELFSSVFDPDGAARAAHEITERAADALRRQLDAAVRLTGGAPPDASGTDAPATGHAHAAADSER